MTERRKRANGDGSVTERKDGRWQGMVYVLMPDGTTVRRYVYGRTEAEANRKMTEAQRRSQAGLPAESTTKLADYLAQWLAEVARPLLRPRTFETYRRCVDRHIVPGLGRKRLNALTPADVRKLLNEKTAEGLAPRTVSYIRAVLRSALSQAVRDGLVHRNVAALARPPRVPRKEVISLTPEEAKSLLTTARGDRLYALWVIALSLGLRRSEVLGLTWSLIDLDGRTVRVARGVQRVGGKLVLDELKSASSHRTLPLPNVAVVALQEYRARQARERLLAGRYWEDQDLVFCTGLGGPIDPRNINRSFRTLLIRSRVGVDLVKEADGREHWVTRVRLHDLRHSCASFLLSQGASPRVVMEILGHSGIAITMNTYAHVLPTLLGGALQGMDDMLGGTANESR